MTEPRRIRVSEGRDEQARHDPRDAVIESLEVALVYHQLRRSEAVATNDRKAAFEHDAAHSRTRRTLRAESTNPKPRAMAPDCLDCAFYERSSR